MESEVSSEFDDSNYTFNETTDILCNSTWGPNEFLYIKFYFIGVLGSSVCVAGVVMNIILLNILLKRYLRNTYLIYLAALAFLDISVAVTYIMVMCVNQFYDYFTHYVLYDIWHNYVPYFFTLSRIVTLASTYMVVACTSERYLEVVQLAKHANKPYKIHQKTRLMVIGFVIGLSTAFRVVVYWELDVIRHPECHGTLAYYELGRSLLVHDFYYAKVYSFHAMHLVQVFFPFAALILLNVLIIRKWRSALRKASVYTADEITKRVQSAQTARKMMATIVATYLACNLLNLVLTFMEHIDRDFLDEHESFYTLSADVVTMLTVINASFRLPIYYACNLRLRNEIRRVFGRGKIHKPTRGIAKKWPMQDLHTDDSRQKILSQETTPEQEFHDCKLDFDTVLHGCENGVQNTAIRK